MKELSTESLLGYLEEWYEETEGIDCGIRGGRNRRKAYKQICKIIKEKNGETSGLGKYKGFKITWEKEKK